MICPTLNSRHLFGEYSGMICDSPEGHFYILVFCSMNTIGERIINLDA